jgi:CBS domain-containing protein
MAVERGRDAEMEVLEGDEGQPEVGRHRDVGKQLLETPLSEVSRSAPPSVPPDAPLSKVVDLMRTRGASAVAVVERRNKRRLVGIFTQHDLVTRALPARGWARAEVRRYMTPAPEALHPKDPIAYALNWMTAGGYQHVPLVDEEGRPAGIVSATDLLAFLVELCPEETLNLPPEPGLAVHHTAEGP